MKNTPTAECDAFPEFLIGELSGAAKSRAWGGCASGHRATMRIRFGSTGWKDTGALLVFAEPVATSAHIPGVGRGRILCLDACFALLG
jgi:hypothetical protein